MKNVSLGIKLIILISLYSCEKDTRTIYSSLEYYPVFSSISSHCGFTDLFYFNNKFYCAFRVGLNHVPLDNNQNGSIVIFSSIDGKQWANNLIIKSEEYDLRDPCFSISSDGKHLLLYCGVFSINNVIAKKTCLYILKSDNNGKLEVENSIFLNCDNYNSYWLWKVVKSNNKYYSFAYRDSNIVFLSSNNGVDFYHVSDIYIRGNEVGFTIDNDIVYAIVRSSFGNSYYISSAFPYTKWATLELPCRIESPECIVISNKLILSGRYDWGMTISSLDIISKEFNYIVNLNAANECGYPGIICSNNNIILSFYTSSSTESKIMLCSFPVRFI